MSGRRGDKAALISDRDTKFQRPNSRFVRVEGQSLRKEIKVDPKATSAVKVRQKFTSRRFCLLLVPKTATLLITLILSLQ